jgi:cytochrome c oxidase subunit 3
MSEAITPAATVTPEHAPAHAEVHGHGPADGHGHGHNPHLAHHFDSPDQQYNAMKLGMWLFLATEILFFGGLFCAYAVYRANHPEIFVYAHQFLDKKLGAINTAVLIFSSLTMAWGVRNAQLGQRRALLVNLILTLVCAFGFLGIKYAEYTAKFQHGLYWGADYKPTPEVLKEAQEHALEHSHGRLTPEQAAYQPQNVQIFFSIYFCMTGLHAIHVLIGMACITWLIVGASQARYGPQWFTPVDLIGLYWHLVDLIWIYLFPLLYLIH